MKVHHFNDPFIDSGCGKPSEMISLVDQNNSPDLFFININYRHTKIQRADNAGIALLKHLRLCGYRQHCVIYSFLSREQLLSMDWRNLIIFSEGVTFVRMPCDLKALDYDELSKKKAPQDLSVFFKAEFQLPDNRHFFANWWGVLRLWQVHKLMLNENDTDTLETSILEHAQKEMMSYQALIAQYIYGINQKEIEKSLAIISKRMKQDRLNDLENERTSVNDKLKEVQIALQNLDTTEASKGSVSRNWMAALKMAFLAFTGRRKDERPAENTRQKLETEKNEYKTRLQQIDDKITLLNKELNEKPNTEQPPELSRRLEGLRVSVTQKHTRILYVDDQANEGWQQIFAHILFGEKADKFSVYQPANENSEAIIKRTVELIRENKPDLIMLDLRLSPEDERTKDVAQISGVSVLKKLRKEFANTLCPVLVVSASNKLWSYKHVLGAGADAYWIKEGLDNRLDADGSSNNYVRLITILDALLFSEEYGQLREIKKIYGQISTEDKTYWFEKERADYNDFAPTKKSTVLSILAEAIKIMEDKLAKGLFIDNRIGKNVDYQVPVVGRLFKIVEDIHKTKQEYEDGFSPTTTLSHKISLQLYGEKKSLPKKIASMIYIRNSAIHEQNLKVDDFKEFVNHLALYLTNPPTHQHENRPSNDEKKPQVIDLTDCISTVKEIKPKEIVLEKPKNMPSEITKCSIIISIAPFSKEKFSKVEKGSLLKYKLTLRKVGKEWRGFPSEVEVFNSAAE